MVKNTNKKMSKKALSFDIDQSYRTAVESNITQLKSVFRCGPHMEWSKGVKSYILDGTDRQRDLCAIGSPERSNFYKPFVRRLSDRITEKLYDTNTQYEVHEMSGDEDACQADESSSAKMRSLVEDRFDDADNRREFFSAVKKQVILGNGFYKAWINTIDGYPKPSIKYIGSFSLFYLWQYDFYNSGMPIFDRQLMSM